jgi:hypothetical protein
MATDQVQFQPGLSMAEFKAWRCAALTSRMPFLTGPRRTSARTDARKKPLFDPEESKKCVRGPVA